MLRLPLRTGPDIDWRSKCLPGDDQGESDACAVFAVANWVECMLGTHISDAETIECWRAERMFRYGHTNGGLQITEAFAAAMLRGKWLPPGTSLRRVSNLGSLPLAPLLTGIGGLDWTLPRGNHCLGRISSGTYHAVLVVADIAGAIWVENSHGQTWGRDGFALMPHDTFAQHALQVWQIILPGAPTTEEEAARQMAIALATSIGDHVRSIARNLAILGYSLPGNGGDIMTDLMRRSMDGQLNPSQNEAKRDLADVYLLLRGGGITDAKINAVWEVIQ
jgi:hypothetical protein